MRCKFCAVIAIGFVVSAINPAAAEKPVYKNNFLGGAYLNYKLDFRLNRQEVTYKTAEAPGTIVINTRKKYLYFVLGGGKAMRYGLSVGRDGFSWKGTERISRKAEWPDWRPPKAMLARRPNLPAFVPGGPGNPLGARALYLGNTEYRIHGTQQPWTIGYADSSGCFRMLDKDVIDLYGRVKIGAKVVVQ
jgi:lipoprotein-anchoring transpeptidase ErfK/SrfK